MATLIDEMIKQSQNIGPTVFCCARCKNYEGSLSCKNGVFIAFEGANLLHCSLFQLGKRCTHCGKIT